MDYGIKISKSGDDVLTADNKDLIFTSNMESHKVKETGTLSSSDTFAHGLTYPPHVDIYQYDDYGAGRGYLAYKTPTACRVDETNVDIDTSTDTFYVIFFEGGAHTDNTNDATRDDFGVRVSKEGYNVISGDTQEMCIDTSFGSRSIKMEGTTTLSTDTNSDWDYVAVTHDFGYIPQFDVWVETVNGGTITVPGSVQEVPAVGTSCYDDCVADSGEPERDEHFRVGASTTQLIIEGTYYCVCFKEASADYTYYANDYTVHYKIYMEEVELP